MFDLFNKAKREELIKANRAALDKHAELCAELAKRKEALANTTTIADKIKIEKQIFEIEKLIADSYVECIITAKAVNRIDRNNGIKVIALIGATAYAAHKLYSHFCD